MELGPLDEKVATFDPTGCPTIVLEGCIFTTGDLQTRISAETYSQTPTSIIFLCKELKIEIDSFIPIGTYVEKYICPKFVVNGHTWEIIFTWIESVPRVSCDDQAKTASSFHKRCSS